MAKQNNLAALLADAYSYESRDKHGAAHRETEYVGSVQKDERIYDIYVDEAGSSWYKTRIVTGSGIVTEYEAIFGRPEPSHRVKR